MRRWLIKILGGSVVQISTDPRDAEIEYLRAALTRERDFSENYVTLLIKGLHPVKSYEDEKPAKEPLQTGHIPWSIRKKNLEDADAKEAYWRRKENQNALPTE